MSPSLRGALARLGGGAARPRLPLHGWPKASIATPLLDALSDAELEELNALLPWNCFTTDGTGRRFGRAARPGKRDTPQPIPDPRIVALDARFGLASARVLEIGCFEGVHTIGLCSRAREVVAVDARVENVVKTVVRAGWYGFQPAAFVCDVDDARAAARLPEAEVVHHVGVLYHLADPVAHLARLAPRARRALMLDTHVARPAEATDALISGGRTYAVRRYREFGRADVFSGMSEHSCWLRLEDLVEILRAHGLTAIETVETREERNGLRVLLYAARG